MIAVKKPKMGLALFFAISEGFFSSLTLGLLMASVLLLVEGNFSVSSLLVLLPFLTLVMGIRFWLGIQSNYRGQLLGASYIKDLRMELGEHMRKVPLGFFQRHRSGDLTSRLMGNIQDVESVVTHLYTDMASAMVAALGIGASLVWIDYRMALVALSVLPLFFPLSWLSKKLAAKYSTRRFSTMAEVNDRFVEFLQGIRILKSHGLALAKLKGLKGAIDQNMKANITLEMVNAPVIIGFQILLEGAFLVTVLVGLQFLLDGNLAPARFLVGVLASFQFFRPLKALSELQAVYRNHQRAGRTLDAIFQEPQQIWTYDNATFQAPLVQAKGLVFGYEALRPVIHGLDFTIKASMVTALVGPSGSGKTTVANLIMRLWDPTGGELLIHGKDVRMWKPEELLEQMAVVFQDVYLFNDTVKANISIGLPGASDEQIIEAARRAQADGFINKLPQGYDTVLAEGGGSLSGGERQRIAIARCLLKNAPIIILDEATASLDPENERFIQLALAELIRGRTVIVIAHRLRTIRNADQILVLDQGRLVGSGRHEDLIQCCQIYKDLWANQEAALGWNLDHRPAQERAQSIKRSRQ